jgi:hypothetical protein
VAAPFGRQWSRNKSTSAILFSGLVFVATSYQQHSFVFMTLRLLAPAVAAIKN